MFRPGLDPSLSNILSNNEGRAISVTINVNRTILNLMNIYVATSPKERKDFFDNIRQYQPKIKSVIGRRF